MSYKMELFQKTCLSDKIKLEPRDLSKSLMKIIPKKLEKKLTGHCTKHGFIKQKSLDIMTVCPGTVEMGSLNGDCTFEVLFHAELCNPTIGSYCDAIVKDINKFGVMAVKGYYDLDNDFHTVLKFVIPKNPIEFQNTINIDQIKINQNILIEVMDKRIVLGNTSIDIVGRCIEYKEKVPMVQTDVNQSQADDSFSERQQNEILPEDEDLIAHTSDTSVQDGGESSNNSDISDDNFASDVEQEESPVTCRKISHFFDDDDSFLRKQSQSSENDSEFFENENDNDNDSAIIDEISDSEV